MHLPECWETKQLAHGIQNACITGTYVSPSLHRDVVGGTERTIIAATPNADSEQLLALDAFRSDVGGTHSVGRSVVIVINRLYHRRTVLHGQIQTLSIALQGIIPIRLILLCFDLWMLASYHHFILSSSRTDRRQGWSSHCASRQGIGD